LRRNLNSQKHIPLIKPYITQEVKDKVCDVLDSGYLTEGSVTLEFEESLKAYIGCRHALAVSNCTVGLEMALRVLGVGAGDEVIVPDYTYPATASVVAIVGAKIVIVDVDPETMLIDYDAVEEGITPQTKAVIPVSIFGNPLDYDRLNSIKEKYGIYVIEDAACSIGARYDGVPVGNLADISVFSFHPRKFITTGEGGLITTNNRKWAEWMDSYKRFGMSSQKARSGIRFERIGTNYKMSDIQAAVGLIQMQHMESLLGRREKLAQNYHKLLSDTPEIRFPEVTPKGKHSWQSCCIFVEGLDRVIKQLRKRDIETQIGTYSLHMHKAFNHSAECKIVGEMTGSRYAFEHCLTLPLYHDMTGEEQEYVVSQLIKVIGYGE
jgi:dTDP-4-amino-4,6-dideoxygalactose transaminase